MATAEEKDYGVIPDRWAWELPLDTDATRELTPFQVFTATPPRDEENPSRIRALARTTGLALYIRRFKDGGGENGLHAHTDDAIWMVLEGRATFFADGDRLLGELEPQGGILVPRLTRYRFVCTGPTLLARFSGGADSPS
jgi:mannose-6-phosphate isomerase-like protein (cupin superfamily)